MQKNSDVSKVKRKMNILVNMFYNTKTTFK